MCGSIKYHVNYDKIMQFTYDNNNHNRNSDIDNKGKNDDNCETDNSIDDIEDDNYLKGIVI